MGTGRETWSLASPVLAFCVFGCSDRSSDPVASAAQAQTAAPLRIGAETPVDDPVYTHHGQHWASSGIAWNGTAYLVAIGSHAWRLDALARPVEPLPLSLPGRAVAAASRGSDYLVAYARTAGVHVSRISSAGVVLDPAGPALSPTANSLTGGSDLASNGSDYLAVWVDSRNGNDDIYGARIGASGQVLDTGGFPIATGSASQTSPAVTWDGARYVAVWADKRSGTDEIYLARVTSAGAVLEAAGARIASGQFPDVASDGERSLVAWGEPSRGIHGARIAQDGSVLDATPITITTDGFAESPSLVWNGTTYVAYYHTEPCGDASGTDGKRVTRDGVVLSTPVGGATCMVYGASEGHAADGTGRHMMLYRRAPYWPDGFRELTATTYGSDGVSLGSWMPTAANQQRKPRIAQDGQLYLVVWNDLRDTDTETESIPLYGARVRADGTIVDSSALVIDRTDSGNRHPSEEFVSLASNGSSFLVASSRGNNGTGLTGRAYRIDSAGSVLAADTFPSRIASGGVQLHTIGTDYLAVWRHLTQAGTASVVLGRRVNDQGALIDSADITFVPSPAMLGAAIYNGTNHFFVWSQGSALFGGLVTASGTMVGSPVQIAATADAPLYGYYFDAFTGVSWDGTNHLVLWRTTQGTRVHLYGARVSTAGVLLDPGGFEIASAAQSQLAFGPNAVAWDGTHHVVTWAAGPWRDAPVHAARVSPSGVVVDSAPLIVAAKGNDPAVASIGNGRSLIAYSRFDDTLKHRAERVWVRTLEPGCDCDSGLCDTSVCSDAGAGPDADAASDDGAATDGSDEGGLDAGANGTGGTSGVGGSTVDSGSRAGSGGTADAAAAGRSGAPGASAPKDEDDSGCGCRAVGAPSAFGPSAILAVLGLFAFRRPRARTRSRGRRDSRGITAPGSGSR